MASPPYRAAGALAQAVHASPSTTTVAVPAGVVDGDFMLLVLRSVYGDVTVTPPAGWDYIAASYNTLSIFNSKCLVYRRVASSEPANYSVSMDLGGTRNSFIARILAWQGGTYDTSDGLAAGGPSTSITIPSVTAAGTDRTLIAIYGQQGNAAYTGPYAADAAMSERVDDTESFGGTEHTSFSVADQAIAAAGATGTRTATATADATWHQAVVLLIAGISAPTPRIVVPIAAVYF